ncbi:MAG: MBL fold metallo-hydrolase [Fimbriimonadaceae bacterium]|nr:MBL fold metallo-hydrolase [Fimbriimonadaceae bacterium]
MIEAVLLGTGTSVGVPFLGCRCAVCQSTDPRNQRLRCSLLLRAGETRVLVDCGPDFRQQALRAGLERLDAVVLTHEHADHLLGLDDLRLFILHQKRPMPIWAQPPVLDAVRRIYSYAFGESSAGSFTPSFELCPLAGPPAASPLAGLPLQPVPVIHSNIPTIGVRIGDLAYLPDVKQVPDESLPLLRGLRHLVIDGLRYREHRTHHNLDEALAAIARIRPQQAWLTHLTHDYDATTAEADLPAGVRLAYDGLTLPVTLDQTAT